MLYNDNDPYVCEWLRNLIAAGHLPEGTVDERSITELDPTELEGDCHFFAGIGGWPLALRWADWTGPVWTGSCPCQPFSTAGKHKGETDERHLWPAFLALIAECRPATIFGEQVSGKAGYRWLDGVRADLEREGYRVGSADLPAACVGAPHIRQRLWWVAYTQRNIQQETQPRSGETRRMGRFIQPVSWNIPWKRSLSRFRAVDDGIPRCVEATDAIRNTIVPQVAAEFVRAYMDTHNTGH